MIISAPSLKLTLDGLIHSTLSMLSKIATYHQFIGDVILSPCLTSDLEKLIFGVN
jgi:hypothetical protein